MAADTRPYKSKEQDGQGNELIIRDQQLVEQASQTTMASGEYFEIVDVDGRMAKIPKANMVDIVREALGTLLNGLSDQTTVTKVPSLNGNTLGASTVATLASVLGAISPKAWVNDVDNIKTTSAWQWGGGSASNPTQDTALLLVINALSNYVAQIVISSNKAFSRVSLNSSSWTNWKEL